MQKIHFSKIQMFGTTARTNNCLAVVSETIQIIISALLKITNQTVPTLFLAS